MTEYWNHHNNGNWIVVTEKEWEEAVNKYPKLNKWYHNCKNRWGEELQAIDSTISRIILSPTGQGVKELVEKYYPLLKGIGVTEHYSGKWFNALVSVNNE